MKPTRFAAALFAASLAALAQDPRGALAGQITDPSNAPAPSVTVRFIHAGTNVSTSAVSNAQGNYEMPYLPIGEYKVTTELAGFKTWNRSGIQVRIGDRLRLDIQLEVGSVTETVDVTAQAPVLESTTGSIGQVIDSKQFSDMPLRVRALMHPELPGDVNRRGRR